MYIKLVDQGWVTRMFLLIVIVLNKKGKSSCSASLVKGKKCISACLLLTALSAALIFGYTVVLYVDELL